MITAVNVVLSPVPRIQFPLSKLAANSDPECRNAFGWAMHSKLGWVLPRGEFSATALQRAATEFKKQGKILEIPFAIFAHKRVIDMSLFLGIAIQAQ